jgi:hypothetical protein
MLRPYQAEVPHLWALLSKGDKLQYLTLKSTIDSNSHNPARNHRVGLFQRVLKTVHQFAVRGDASDWKRCMVCGVFWLPPALAVNTSRLRLLVPRCKSSINGCIRLMGYTETLSHTESARVLNYAWPSSIDFSDELKQWTVRTPSVGLQSMKAQAKDESPMPIPEDLFDDQNADLLVWEGDGEDRQAYASV